jgi:hypothetical protein
MSAAHNANLSPGRGIDRRDAGTDDCHRHGGFPFYRICATIEILFSGIAATPAAAADHDGSRKRRRERHGEAAPGEADSTDAEAALDATDRLDFVDDPAAPSSAWLDKT